MAKAFQCPSCGAPLEVEEDKTTIKCKYCNETVIVPKEIRQDAPIPHFTISTTGNVEVPEQKGKKSPLVIILVLLTIVPILFGLGIGLLPLLAGGLNAIGFFPTGLTAINFRVFDPPVLIQNEQAGMPDLFIPVRDAISEKYLYVFMDGKDHSIRWRSEPLSDDWTQTRVFSDADHIYLLDQTNLSAYNRLNGEVLWKQTLSNGLGYCQTCIRQFGNSIVLLLKDGTLQAIDSSNGDLTWHKTLQKTNAILLPIGNKPAVIDEDAEQNALVYIFDPLTGRVAQQFTPQCPPGNSSSYFDEADANPVRNNLVLFFTDCVQQVSLPEGNIISEVYSPNYKNNSGSLGIPEQEAWPTAWFATNRMITQDAIYYTANGSGEPVNVLDLNQGDARLLIVDKKYNLMPVQVSGNVLIVEATPTYDSNQHEYWGVDSLSGQRLWAYPLRGEGDLEFYSVRAASTGIFVLQCREEPDTCTWTTLDPLTGTGSNTGTGPGGVFSKATWDETHLYLYADGKMTVVDMTTGETLYSWP